MERARELSGCVTVVLSGELDHYTAPDIREQLDRILTDARITQMILDMERLTFMDSSGIGVLLGRLKTLQLRGGGLMVKNMQPHIARLFRLTGMQRVITVLDDIGGGVL